jgi:hypothetical protein
MFVSTERVALTEGDDTIYIRTKMDVGTKNRVQSDITHFSQTEHGGNVVVSIGLYQLILLRRNILDWDGPSFLDEQGKKIPCTPDNIERLDPDEPLVVKALEQVQERNLVKKSPNPKLAERNGSRNDGNQSLTESLNVA